MNDKNNNTVGGKHRWLAWLSVGLVAFVIFCLSAQPHSAEFTREFFGRWNGEARQLAHIVEFAALFTVLRWALGKTIPRAGFIGLCLIAFVASSAYAFIDEWHQSFVPGRTSSIDHVVTDMIGISIAAGAWLIAGVGKWLMAKNRSG